MNLDNKFLKITTSQAARRGRFTTSNGSFETPNFMPVATQGSVKGVDIERVREIGAQIILVNTYHLMLRPGAALVEKLGGIHQFTGFKGPILSDSGGFQVFSLKGIRSISESGVKFRSHIDGSEHILTPESSIGIQEQLGVDIAMAFDECPSTELSQDDVRKSLELTLRWAKRSLEARTKPDRTALFGITQGGLHRELRTVSAQQLSELPFDGYAIGGLSVGEQKEQMYDVLSYHPEQLPTNSIRYLMGVGTPQDLVEGVSRGVDLFDCVMPTRAGRFGRAFISGPEPWINLRNARFVTDSAPLDNDCNCLICRNYSRAYIAHLFRADEMLGPQSLSVHNLAFYLRLMREIREAIEAGTFSQLYSSVSSIWKGFKADG